MAITSKKTLFDLGFPDAVSTAQLQELLGVTRETVSDLEQRGIITKAKRGWYPFAATLRAYTSHLREIAAGRQGADGSRRLMTAREEYAAAQAEGQRLKNAKMRGDLVERRKVDATMRDCVVRTRASMMRLPARLASEAANRPAPELRALLEERIADALATLADIPIIPAPEDADRE